MKLDNLKNYVRGWLIGDFEPTLHKTKDFEVCVKRLKAGEKESRHYHKLTTEFTILISGQAKMNGIELNPDDVFVLDPNEISEFEAITDCITVGIRNGSFPSEKYDV